MVQEWFTDAKLGIFITWGIYSVDGVEESWAFFRGDVSHKDYMAQLNGFTASAYRPGEWAELIAQSGAQYTVLTTKHHEGVALWNTAQSELSIPHKTPAARDVLTPFCREIRKRGLHLGLYFSLSDWNHPDYASVFHAGWGNRYNQGLGKDALGDQFGFAYPKDGMEKPQQWERYLAFQRAQLKELQDAYDPDLFWFDGDWERTSEQWGAPSIVQTLRAHKNTVMINSRLCGLGDYATPEQSIPLRQPPSAWESCMTLNDSWGWRHDDQNYKSARKVVRMFAEILSLGGNLLLDIGPRGDGSIPDEVVSVLTDLGRWNRDHHDAVFGTRAGLPAGHFHGPSTISQDGRSLFLFLSEVPSDEVMVRGIRNTVLQARVLGGPTTRQPLKTKVEGGAPWYAIPGVLWIDTSGVKQDPLMTVLQLELDGPLDLYQGTDSPFGIAGSPKER